MVEQHLDNRRILTEYILASQADFYRLAYSYVKDRDAALDVVQESIVKALTKADSLRNPEHVKTPGRPAGPGGGPRAGPRRPAGPLRRHGAPEREGAHGGAPALL